MAESKEFVYKVLSDVSGFVKNMAKADASLKKFGDNATRLGKQMSVALTAPVVAMGVKSIKAFDEQIQAEQALASAVRVTGGNVQESMSRFKEFASTLQEVTIHGDEATLKNIQLAKSMGLSDSQAMRASKNAMALADATGMSAASAIRYTAALEQGDSTMLNRYLPTLRQIKDPTERAAKAQELLGNMFDISTEKAKVGLGPLTQLRNNFGDFLEDIGKIISEGLEPFINRLNEMVLRFKAMSPETKKVIVVVGALLAAIGPLTFSLGLFAKMAAFSLKSLKAMRLGIMAISKASLAMKFEVIAVIAIISALVAAGVYLYKDWDAVKEQLNIIAIKIRNSFIEAFATILDKIGIVAKTINKIVGKDLLGTFEETTKKIRDMKKEVPKASEEFSTFGSVVKEVVTVAKGRISSLIGDIEATPQKIKGVTDSIKAEMQKSAEGSINISPIGLDLKSNQEMIDKSIKGHQEMTQKIQANNKNHLQVMRDMNKENIKRNQEDNLAELSNTFNAMQSTATMLGDTMANIFQGTADAGQAVKQLAQQAIGSIFGMIRANVIANATNPLNPNNIATGGLAAPALALAGLAFAETLFKQVIGSFANGGIVGGSSFQGDRVLARVNSGEMILNKAQQGRLFAMINNPNMGSSVGFGGRLRGEDIFFSQERSTNRLSRYR